MPINQKDDNDQRMNNRPKIKTITPRIISTVRGTGIIKNLAIQWLNKPNKAGMMTMNNGAANNIVNVLYRVERFLPDSRATNCVSFSPVIFPFYVS